MSQLLLLSLVAAAISWGSTPLARRLAIRLGALDLPDARRVHLRATPRFGGVVICLSIVLTLAAGVATGAAGEPIGHPDPYRFLSVAVAAIVIFGIGLYDDLRPLRPGAKLAAQLPAAVLVAAGGHWISSIFGVTVPGWAAAPLTVIWVLAATNAFNLIDGLDGLAVGVALIVSATLLAVALYGGHPGEATVLAVLGGALFGFLPHNSHPARIFLGDSGSLLVGFLLAVIAIDVSAKLSATVAIVVPLLALGLPLIDLALAIARRLLRALHVVRRVDTTERYEFFFAGGKAIFTADRAHIHHRLLDLGLTYRNAVLFLYAVVGLLCACAFLLTLKRDPNVGFVLGAVAVIAVGGIRRLGYGELRVLRNGTLLPLFDLSLAHRRMTHVLVDLGFVVTSFVLAASVANEGISTGPSRARFLESVPIVALAQIAALATAGLYGRSYRYMGVSDLLVILRAIALAGVAGGIACAVIEGFRPVYTAVMILDIYFLATLILGARISFRVLEHLFKAAECERGRRVLIYGAGHAGTLALREMQGNAALDMRAVGFLDDDPRKCSRIVSGCPVFALDTLEHMIRKRAFDELIVSTEKIPAERLGATVSRCARAGLTVRHFSIRWEAPSAYEPRGSVDRRLQLPPRRKAPATISSSSRGASDKTVAR